MTWKVGPALACGNTVVVKPSEETPSTATLLGEVMNKVGVPKGVYNVVHGFGPEFGRRIPDAPSRVDAHHVHRRDAHRNGDHEGRRGTHPRRVDGARRQERRRSCSPTADFDAAVDGIARASFANTGQVCLGTERVYVERPIFDKFVAALAREGREHEDRPARGDTDTQLGPLISHEHREKVLSYYKKAVDEGATVVTGGKIPDMGKDLDEGAWVAADDLDRACPRRRTVVQEEIFGPCCHVQPFDTEDEAVRMANDTQYGLATTVWTATSRARTALPRRSTWASAGSTAGSCATCARRSAVPRTRASAAKAACIRSSSTRSCATSA